MAGLMWHQGREIRLALLSAAALAALATAGCQTGQWNGVWWSPKPSEPAEAVQGSASLEAWATGEMVQLTTQTTAAQAVEQSDVFDARARIIRLTAAANETVAFQTVVDADRGPLRRVSVRLRPAHAPAGAPLPEEWIKLYRLWPVQVRTYPSWYRLMADRPADPAGFYDRLVSLDAPGEALPADLPADGRLALWADVRVPREAKAGRYVLYLDLAAEAPAPDQPPPARRLVVELEVLDVVLPDTRSLIAAGGFDHAALFRGTLRRDGQPFTPQWMDRDDPLVARGLVLMRQLMVLAHEHKLDLFDTALRPTMKRDATGQVQLDWQDYDAVARPYLDGTAFADRIGCALWPAPLDDTWPEPQRHGGITSPAYTRTAGEVIEQTVAHFDTLAASGQLFFWPVRERLGAPDAATQRRAAYLAGLIRPRAPRTPILWQSADGAVQPRDMLAPPAAQLQPSSDSTKARLFLTPGRPPYVPAVELPASPADVRALPWLAYRMGMRGLLLTDALGWAESPGADEPAVTGLFYADPQLGEILPSVRLKWLRRGMEDLAYLSVLRQRMRGDLVEAIGRTMARYVGQDAAGDCDGDVRLDGWAAEGRSWESARRLLAQEVLATVRPDEQNQQRALELRLAWQRLDEAVHDILPEALYTHAEPADRPDRLKVTVQVELFNPLGRPAWITLSLPEPPEGVTVLTGRQEVAALPPSGRQMLQLSYTTAVGPTSAGKALVPLRLEVNGRPPRALPARVPLLTGQRINRPIVIDGDLGDWPMATGNAAGEFRLVGRRGRPEHGLARWPTTAFVGYDDTTLYVAFRCSHPAAAPLSARPANVVRYEQRLAIGEDLVELLLDPGARAAGPESLYRIAVKANGVHVAGRGAPPTGEAASAPAGGPGGWSVQPAVAIGRSGDTWIAELAIPLASFGPGGRERLWGVNFIRHTVPGGETSSWSEAPRHFWDLRTLGTLVLRPGPAGR